MQIEELFCSEITKENRNKVRNSTADSSPDETELVTGIVYESDGRYHKYWLRYEPDNIARFICSDDKDKLVCNGADYALFNTQGKYIDLFIGNSEFLKTLLYALKKYQKNLKINTIFDIAN